MIQIQEEVTGNFCIIVSDVKLTCAERKIKGIRNVLKFVRHSIVSSW